MRINIPRIFNNKLKKSNRLDNKKLTNEKISELLSIDYDKKMKKFVNVLIKSGIATTDDLMKHGIFDNLKTIVNEGITSPDELVKLTNIIINGNQNNITVITGGGINKADDLVKLEEIIIHGNSTILKILIEGGINKADDLAKLEDIIKFGNHYNVDILIKTGINKADNLVKLTNIILYGEYRIIEALINEGITSPDDLIKLSEIIKRGEVDNVNVLIKAGINKVDTLVKLEDIIRIGNHHFIEALLEAGITSPDDLIKLKYITMTGRYDVLKILIEAGINKADDLVKLKDIIIHGYCRTLRTLIKIGINKADDLVKCTEIIKNGEEIDLDKLVKVGAILLEKVQKYSKLQSQGFDIKDYTGGYNKILSDTINSLHPNMQLDIELTEKEAEKIINFVNSIGGINKGYTILILTVEKMIKDGVMKESFTNILLKKLNNYQKILDMYPEDKIPEGLKISTGLEIEMTEYFGNWYQTITGEDYQTAAYKITEKAKVARGKDGVIEFSTKPSTNPLVTLLEIHLLQELNLLDLNDMQKLSGFTKDVGYSSRNGTGYHLNIGSDTDIAQDENINFIQNLSTILPRSGISNGDKVDEINQHGNIFYRYSNYSVYPSNTSNDYIELRTYSVDDVELFERNVLFNTYAVMGSQAQNKVSKVEPDTILKLKDNKGINNADDLLYYLENYDYFLENKDLKSKKIAAEFMFMQISILRTIDNYNNNFIDNELFSDEIFSELSEPWKDLLYDLLLSDQKETIGFEDKGLSSIVVKRHATNLYKSFDANEYMKKEKPFNSDETKDLLNKCGDTVDEKWIPYITKWLNKKILWEILCQNCSDYGEEGWSERLENKIRDKISNIDRIKSYIRGDNKDIKIDRQYLLDYFEKNMSLGKLDPYEEIDTDFVNRIIHLNNFFLKEDNTNANSVLDTTVVDGQKYVEHDISQSSVFDTGYMRKGYNYYQGGSENMLLHSAQKIALNYMGNVKDILNTNYGEGPTIKMAA